jgi:membrane protease YdiL (CAAX protease family)
MPSIRLRPLKRKFPLSSSDNSQFEAQPAVRVEPPAHVQSDSSTLGPDPAVIVSPATTSPPVENPVWSGWDVLLMAGLTIVAMLVLQILVVFGALWLVYPHLSFAEVAQKPILLLGSQFLIYIAVAACMVMLVEGKYHAPFWQAIRWNWPRSQWQLLMLGAVMLLALGLLQSILPMPKDTPFEHLFDRPRDAYLLAIIAVSVGPLMEELFFRGFFYPVVARRWGAAWGIFLTALPFALMHLPQYGWAWGAMLVILVVGVVCGMVRAVTRSVGASFLVHVGYNGTQMLIAIVATQGFRHMPKALANLCLH